MAVFFSFFSFLSFFSFFVCFVFLLRLLTPDDRKSDGVVVVTAVVVADITRMKE